VVGFSIPFLSQPRRCSGAAPTNTLAMVRVETQQVLATRDLSAPVTQVSFSPTDDALCCVSGRRYLRLVRREHDTLIEMPLLDPIFEADQTFTEHVCDLQSVLDSLFCFWLLLELFTNPGFCAFVSAWILKF
jgi:hypothetical protein